MNDSWVHRIRDKARVFTHKFSHFLGEADEYTPSSLLDAKRAQNLVEVDLPSFRSVLPYESVDEDLLFINRSTAGFGLHVLPASGADMSLMKSMAELF